MRSSVPPGLSPGSRLELYEDPYVTVLPEPDGTLVRVIRTEISHPSPQVMEQSFLKVSNALDRFGRSGHGLLVDVRRAIGRNEPEYEAPLRRVRLRNDAGFLRIAVLLRTSVGMLQMMRLSEEDGIIRLITTSEEHAVKYLRTGVATEDVPASLGKPRSAR